MKKKFKGLNRRFDGKVYEFVGSRGTKKDAQDAAKRARKYGTPARVVKRGDTKAPYHIFHLVKRK